jgi:hypothetical protein
MMAGREPIVGVDALRSRFVILPSFTSIPTQLILHKCHVRGRAHTDLCRGRSVMGVVPWAPSVHLILWS